MTRDTLIITGICVVAIVIGGLVFLGTPSGSISSGAAVEVRVVAEGTNARMTERKNYRVINDEQLESVWNIANGQSVDALPDVDFATEEVLVAFSGEKPTGGYAVRFASITDTATARKVVVEHVVPGENCITTQAITSPYQFVRVPKTDKKIDRTDRTVTVACN